MTKIGRNDPCSCGSGKKYKKCCLGKVINEDSIKIERSVPAEITQKFAKIREKEQRLREVGIYINFVNPIIFKDKKAWAIGSRVYLNRPPNETFHDFLLYILQTTLGEVWWNNELKTYGKNRHFIMECFSQLDDWAQKNRTESHKVKDGVWVAKPNGYAKYLLSLAFDICSLLHTSNLPNQLLNRLKNKREFQGARYEIAIAAIFARLGYSIKFLDDGISVITEKHCEFIVTHKQTGEIIGIEVKSRHRKGILHELGRTKLEKLFKGDIQRLLSRALKQIPKDMPFMIFIDQNSPLTPELAPKNKPWVRDIIKKGKKHQSSKQNPDLFNAIFITNYSYHYLEDKEAKSGEFLAEIPIYTKYNISNLDIFKMLYSALNHYGFIPNIDVDE